VITNALLLLSQEGYTVPSFLQDHINRKRRPTRHCDIWYVVTPSSYRFFLE
jgi:hypothetical protein